MSFNIKYGLALNELLGDLISVREASVCRSISRAVRTEQTDVVLEGLEMSMEQMSSELHFSLYKIAASPTVFSWGTPWNQEPLWQTITEVEDLIS